MDIRVYCVRVAHYYAFGITPEAAIATLPVGSGKEGARVVEHVARQKDSKHYNYVMHALPVGVTKAWVDDMGGLGWEGPEKGLQQLYYNPNTGRWSPEEAKDEREPQDVLDARFEPYDDAANTLEGLTQISSSIIDIDDAKVRAKLKELGKRVRYALEDLGV